MLNQITVFLENEKGRLAAMSKIIADAGVNMSSFTVADTASFGVARILADDPKKAVDALLRAGYRAKLVEVSAVEIPNAVGSLATLLGAFAEEGLNLEYAYCFASNEERVVVVFRVEDAVDKISEVVQKLGYRRLHATDL